ncbi:MAG: MarR family transcriptional regulator [Oscillospiraceae bacterium]|nr:MarR family transcriptional regulator [Oscillospiraceae bacterium]
MSENSDSFNEELLFTFFDCVKSIWNGESWGSLLVDYSKNEILALVYLYRVKEATMTEIAEYLGAPLNTATGVISRLEKKKLVSRVRSEQDRRVVNIAIQDEGMAEVRECIDIMSEYYGTVCNSLSSEEMTLLMNIFTKFVYMVNSRKQKKTENIIKPPKKVKRITIE